MSTAYHWDGDGARRLAVFATGILSSFQLGDWVYLLRWCSWLLSCWNSIELPLPKLCQWMRVKVASWSRRTLSITYRWPYTSSIRHDLARYNGGKAIEDCFPDTHARSWETVSCHIGDSMGRKENQYQGPMDRKCNSSGVCLGRTKSLKVWRSEEHALCGNEGIL